MPEISSAAAAAAAFTTEQSSPILESIVKEGGLRTSTRGKELVSALLTQLKSVSPDESVEQAIAARIAEIDREISLQLNEILHHPEFQKLEASWRGLRYLMENSETGEMLKIKIFNATKKELLRDFKSASDFDQSALFKKVYEEEFGQFGGMPFAALLGDFEFGLVDDEGRKEDLDLLTRISKVAAAAHAPFLAAAAPNLLRMKSFTDLGKPRDIGKVFDSTEYVDWKAFRESDESRYVGLVLPHVLMRLPYGPGGQSTEAFDYREEVDGTDHSKYLWGNAVYALGTRLTDAFAKYHWCAAIRGVEGGGVVKGLPAHTFTTDEGEVALKCPTEIAISDRRDKELADQGLISLVHCKNTSYAAFFGVQSGNRPSQYNLASANENAQLSAQLPYIFATCRFAHYLKAMMRDKIGSFTSRQECQHFLNNWIGQYVTRDDTASFSVKAEHPLRDATIEVLDVPGKPGAYRAVAFLRPHFQLDELKISLRLVAELPAPARS